MTRGTLTFLLFANVAMLALIVGVIPYTEYMVCFFIIVVSLAPIVYYGARRRFFEEPICFLGASFFVFYGLASFGPVLLGRWSNVQFATSSTLVVLGLLSAYVGYGSTGRLAIKLARRIPSFEKGWKKGRLFAILLILVVAGGIALQKRFAATGTSVFSPGSGLPLALQTAKLRSLGWTVPLLLCPSIALILSWLYLCTNKSSKVAYFAWTLAFGVTFYVYLIVGSRSRLVFPLIASTAIYHLVKRHLATSSLILLLGLIWGGYIAFGQTRTTLFTEDVSAEIVADEGFAKEYLSGHGDLGQFKGTMDAIDTYPYRAPYQWGLTLVTPFTTWIPRSIWPGKPLSGASEYTKTRYPEAWSKGITAAPGIICEYYMNLGWVGVILFMFVTGFGLRCVRDYRETHAADTSAQAIYACLIMPIATTGRGDVQYLGMTAQVILLILVAALWFSRGTTRRII